MHENDPVLIIGAGMAGLAAAAYFKQNSIAYKILEARKRVGGRLYNSTDFYKLNIDHGAEWLHSADINPLSQIAKNYGLEIKKVQKEKLKSHNWLAHQLKHLLAEEKITECCQELHWFIYDHPKNTFPIEDLSYDKVLPENWVWEDLARAYIRFLSGAELEKMSLLDISNYHDSEKDWQLSPSFGELARKMSLEHQKETVLDCVVKKISWSLKNSIHIETSKGNFTAKKVLITCPTSCLAREKILFSPKLPLRYQEAFHKLPMGKNNKIFIKLKDKALSECRDDFYLSNWHKEEIISFCVRPLGRPLVSAFLGGQLAEDLENAGNLAAKSFLAEKIASVFGQDILPEIEDCFITGWSSDPYSLGSYSYAEVGAAKLRDVLATPLDDRLFFAGEATSKKAYSTAHGAYHSGLKRAQQMS